jgi:hypothetical protein
MKLSSATRPRAKIGQLFKIVLPHLADAALLTVT